MSQATTYIHSFSRRNTMTLPQVLNEIVFPEKCAFLHRLALTLTETVIRQRVGVARQDGGGLPAGGFGAKTT